MFRPSGIDGRAVVRRGVGRNWACTSRTIGGARARRAVASSRAARAIAMLGRIATVHRLVRAVATERRAKNNRGAGPRARFAGRPTTPRRCRNRRPDERGEQILADLKRARGAVPATTPEQRAVDRVLAGRPMGWFPDRRRHIHCRSLRRALVREVVGSRPTTGWARKSGGQQHNTGRHRRPPLRASRAGSAPVRMAANRDRGTRDARAGASASPPCSRILAEKAIRAWIDFDQFRTCRRTSGRSRAWSSTPRVA